MNRLRQKMNELRDSGGTALVIYITQADPSPAETADIVIAATEAGADVIELGVPFSDPNADGVVIQAAMQRALEAGGGLTSALETVANIRQRGCEVPIVLFGYYNPIFVHGVVRFAADAAAAGVDAVLTVDLPIEELDELRLPLAKNHVDVVPLVAPTSGIERIDKLAAIDPPFVYYVSMTGVTGAAFQSSSEGAERVARIKVSTGAPVCVGFGIKTADDARAVSEYADGVVVGSAIVRRIESAEAGGAAAAVAELVAELKSAL